MLSLFHPRTSSSWLEPFEWSWPEPEGRTHRDVSVWSPTADVVEKEKEYHVRVEVPGLDTKDVKIIAKDGFLEVSGERQHESKDEKVENGVRYLRQESSRGSFSRRWRLPENLDPSKITASSSKGILEIVVPKPEEKKKEEHEVVIQNME